MSILRGNGKGAIPLEARAASESFSRRLIAAQEEERKRLARDLHDSVGQTLLIIKNRAFLAGQVPQVPARVVEQLTEISNLAMQAIEEVREISYALRPFQLDWLGLTKAIQGMLAKVSRAGGFKVIADIDSLDGLFSPEAEINLYRIAQECLTNIAKHARAAVVEVTIKSTAPHLAFSVQDDGCGFDASCPPDSSGGGGLGLIDISERVRILGGHLLIHSQPGQGARLSMAIPLPPLPHEP